MLVKEKKENNNVIERDIFDINEENGKLTRAFEFSGDKREYISLTQAASFTHFSQEYLSLLVRQNKIPAQKFGRNWKVQMEEVENYIAKVEEKTRKQAVKKELENAPAMERAAAKIINGLTAANKEIYSPLVRREFTNFARHKFQSVMASFLILTTVAMTCFFWFEPAQAAKLELGLQRAAAKAVMGAAKAAKEIQVKARSAGLALIKRGGEVLNDAELILASDGASRTEQLKKAGAGAIIKIGEVGALVDRGLSVLEKRAVKRQGYVLSAMESAVTESLKNIDAMSGDLAATAKQTLSAPLAVIPAPIKYALDSGIGAANGLAVLGTDKLQRQQDNLVRSNAGTVAGISEINGNEPVSLGKQFIAFINDTAKRQQNFAGRLQQNTNKSLARLLSYERSLGTAILTAIARTTDKSHNFVAQKINANKERVLGVKIAADDANGDFLQKVDGALLAVNDGVNYAQSAWQAEEAESKQSLTKLWAQALDFILPDALKQKFARQTISPEATEPEKVSETAVPQTIIIREKTAAAPAGIPATANFNDIAVKNDAAVGRNLTVLGKTNLAGEVAVAGTAHFTGPIFAESDITSAGIVKAARFEGAALSVTGEGTIGSLHVLQEASFDGLVKANVLSVSGNANVGGSLIVAGHFMPNSIGASYDISAGRSLSAPYLVVSKDGTISENLYVKRNLDITLNANIDGALTVDGNATLSSNASVGGNLTVSGNATTTGSFYVGGVLTTGSSVFTGPVTVTDNSANTAVVINQQGTGNIVQLQDNGTAILTAIDGGNIGIGTTSPYARLSLWSPTTNTGATVFNIADNASTTLLTV
ncbi:hypothetical protein COU00_02545, partial [Candidatus Falkowbacteria bacterium CG10_big_fil_rev_8_21_14_0_10_43_11]